MIPTRKILLVGIVAALLAVRASETIVRGGDNGMEKWTAHLRDDDKVFGDYVEASVTSDMALRSRALVEASINAAPKAASDLIAGDGKAVENTRLAERALWAGSNIEYSAFLGATATEQRKDHATTALRYLARLRQMLRAWPSSKLDPKAVMRWQDAMLRMKSIEDEVSPEAESFGVNAMLVARHAVIDEWDKRKQR
jgi:hypothetical protein